MLSPSRGPEALGHGARGGPPDAGQHAGYSLLVGHADLSRSDIERAVSHFRDGGALEAFDEPPNWPLPRIGLVARRLLRLDMLALECAVRPPMIAHAVGDDGLGE